MIISFLFSCTKKQSPLNLSKVVHTSHNKPIEIEVEKSKKIEVNNVDFCSLELLNRNGFKPHTIVKEDLNNDGTKDTFFL